MEIKTREGIVIYCLPDGAICLECGTNPVDMDVCPLAGNDDCVPELCDKYTELI